MNRQVGIGRRLAVEVGSHSEDHNSLATGCRGGVQQIGNEGPARRIGLAQREELLELVHHQGQVGFVSRVGQNLLYQAMQSIFIGPQFLDQRPYVPLQRPLIALKQGKGQRVQRSPAWLEDLDQPIFAADLGRVGSGRPGVVGRPRPKVPFGEGVAPTAEIATAQGGDQAGAHQRGFATPGGADHGQEAAVSQGFQQPVHIGIAAEEEFGVFFVKDL